MAEKKKKPSILDEIKKLVQAGMDASDALKSILAKRKELKTKGKK